MQGHKEWINEVNFLGVVNHPNLVRLVGYCAEDDERGIQRLLVYELMRNKSLEDRLLARTPLPLPPLPWVTRLSVAQDAARGLAYLHEEMDFQVYTVSTMPILKSKSWACSVPYANCVPVFVILSCFTVAANISRLQNIEHSTRRQVQCKAFGFRTGSARTRGRIWACFNSSKLI